jgi:hypothetical protein
MKFFTSRYTAALEEQVRDLKADLAERKQTILALYSEIAELRLQATGTTLTSAVENQPEKPEPPRAVNWLRARLALESPDQIVREAPEKEKTANGTR